ncbi:MAG TPA: hypothetical protein VFS67_11015 [Polyangiaceae bacterium]|nr:hypothetical protein [Polyangiaceae bacterium]
MGLLHASFPSSIVLLTAMVCCSVGSSAASKSGWIASHLQSRATYGAALVHSSVTWSVADQLKVQVQIEKGGQQQAADYLWKVAKEPADAAQATLAQLVAKRGGPQQGPVQLSTGTGEKESDPLELSARDALSNASHLHYTQALTAQKWAQALAAKGQVNESIEATLLGIHALGDRYQSPGLDDDTEMNLIAGNAALQHGRQKEAQGLLEGVLRGRLEAYQKLRSPTPAQ